MTTGATTGRAPYPAAGRPERERLLARLADRARFIRLETVRLAEIPGAGHISNLENPDLFTRTLKDFLTR